MSIISIITAVDETGGLGKNNKLLCHLPADLKHFKQNTLGKPIIMGRNTFFSIGKALPDRQNIVVSSTVKATNEITVVSSLQEALNQVVEAPEVMIIGGAQLYAAALPSAQRIYLTRIHATFVADVYFPTFDKQQWHCLSKIEHPMDDKNQYSMTFYLYERMLGFAGTL